MLRRHKEKTVRRVYEQSKDEAKDNTSNQDTNS